MCFLLGELLGTSNNVLYRRPSVSKSSLDCLFSCYTGKLWGRDRFSQGFWVFCVTCGHGGWCLLCRRCKHRQALMPQQIAQHCVTPGQCVPPSQGPAQKFRGFPKRFALAFVHPQVMIDLSSPCQAPNSPSLLWQELHLRALPL